MNSKPSMSLHAIASIELLSKLKRTKSLSSIVFSSNITSLQNQVESKNSIYPGILNDPQNMNNISTYKDPSSYIHSRGSKSQKQTYTLYKQGKTTDFLRKRKVQLSAMNFYTINKGDQKQGKNKKQFLRGSTLTLDSKQTKKNDEWKDNKSTYRLKLNYYVTKEKKSKSSKNVNNVPKQELRQMQIYTETEKDQLTIKDLIFDMRISLDNKKKLLEHMSTLQDDLYNSVTMFSMLKILSVRYDIKKKNGLMNDMKNKLKENFDFLKKKMGYSFKEALKQYRNFPKEAKNEGKELISASNKRKNVVHKNGNHSSKSLNDGKKSIFCINELLKSLKSQKENSNTTQKKKQLICTDIIKNNESKGRHSISVNFKKFSIEINENIPLIKQEEINEITTILTYTTNQDNKLSILDTGMIILGPRKRGCQKYSFKYKRSFYQPNETFCELDANLNIPTSEKEKCIRLQIFGFTLNKTISELKTIKIQGTKNDFSKFEKNGINDPKNVEFLLKIYYQKFPFQKLELKVGKTTYKNSNYVVEVNQEIYLSQKHIEEYGDIYIDLYAIPRDCYDQSKIDKELKDYKPYLNPILFGSTVIQLSNINNIKEEHKFYINKDNNSSNKDSYFLMLLYELEDLIPSDEFYGISFALGSPNYKTSIIDKTTITRFLKDQKLYFYGNEFLFKLRNRNADLKKKIQTYSNNEKTIYENLLKNENFEFLPEANFINSTDEYEIKFKAIPPKSRQLKISKETFIFHSPELEVQKLEHCIGILNNELIYMELLSSELNKTDISKLDFEKKNTPLSSNMFNELNGKLLNFKSNDTKIRLSNYKWYYYLQFQNSKDHDVFVETLKYLRQKLKLEKKTKKEYEQQLDVNKLVEYFKNFSIKDVTLQISKLKFFDNDNKYDEIKVHIRKENDNDDLLFNYLKQNDNSILNDPEIQKLSEKFENVNQGEYQYCSLFPNGEHYNSFNQQLKIKYLNPKTKIKIICFANNKQYFAELKLNSINDDGKVRNPFKNNSINQYLSLCHLNSSQIIGYIFVTYNEEKTQEMDISQNKMELKLSMIKNFKINDEQIDKLLVCDPNVVLKNLDKEKMIHRSYTNSYSELTNYIQERKIKLLNYKLGKELFYQKLDKKHGLNPLPKTDIERYCKDNPNILDKVDVLELYYQPYECRNNLWEYFLNIKKLLNLTKNKIKERNSNAFQNLSYLENSELKKKLVSYYYNQIKSIKTSNTNLKYVFNLIEIDCQRFEDEIIDNNSNLKQDYRRVAEILKCYFIWATEEIHLNNQNNNDYNYIYFEGLFYVTLIIYSYLKKNNQQNSITYCFSQSFWILVGLAQIIPFFKQSNPLYLKNKMSIFFYYSNVSKMLIKHYEKDIYKKFKQLNFPLDTFITNHLSSLFSDYFNEDLFIIFLDYMIVFSAHGFYQNDPGEAETAGLRILCAVSATLFSKNKKQILSCETVSQLLRIADGFVLKTFCAIDFIKKLRSNLKIFYEKEWYEFIVNGLLLHNNEGQLMQLDRLYVDHHQNQNHIHQIIDMNNEDFLNNQQFGQNVKKLFSLEHNYNYPNGNHQIEIELLQITINISKPSSEPNSKPNSKDIKIFLFREGSSKQELKIKNIVQEKINNNKLYFYVYYKNNNNPNKIEFTPIPSNNPIFVPFETNATGDFSNIQVSFLIVYSYKPQNQNQNQNNFSAIISKQVLYINPKIEKIFSDSSSYLYESIDPNAKYLPYTDTSQLLSQYFNNIDNTKDRNQLIKNSTFKEALSNLLKGSKKKEIIENIENSILKKKISLDEILYSLVLTNKMNLEEKLKELFIIARKGNDNEMCLISRVKEMIYFLYEKFHIYFSKSDVDNMIDAFICKDKKLTIYHVLIGEEDDNEKFFITEKFNTFINFYTSRTEKTFFTEKELCEILRLILTKEILKKDVIPITITWGHNNMIFQKYFVVQKEGFSIKVSSMSSSNININQSEDISKAGEGLVIQQPYKTNEISFKDFKDKIFFNLPYIPDNFRIISFFDHGYSIDRLTSQTFLYKTINTNLLSYVETPQGRPSLCNNVKGFQPIHLGEGKYEFRECQEEQNSCVRYFCFEHNGQFNKNELFLSVISTNNKL